MKSILALCLFLIPCVNSAVYKVSALQFTLCSLINMHEISLRNKLVSKRADSGGAVAEDGYPHGGRIERLTLLWVWEHVFTKDLSIAPENDE